MEAEREAVAMYRAYMMRDQVGQRFEGVISAVTNFGAFVELEEPYVEGLIKLDTLGDEPWDYDQVHMRLTGRKTGKMLELGDKVQVDINNVSVVRRRIDFTLIAVAHAGKTVDHVRKQRPEQPGKPRDIRDVEKRRKAAREVSKVTARQTERGAAPRRESKSGSGGKLQLGVSHRGMTDRAGGAKRGGKPQKKRR